MNPQSHSQFASRATLIVTALLAVGCGKNQDQAGWWQGEQQRIELSQQLQLKKYRYEQVHSRDLEQLENLRLMTTGNVALLKSLRQQHLALSGKVESLEGQWAGFREATLRDQRQSAMRKTFDKFTSASGRTFVQVSVVSIDDSGVTIRHADGSARLKFADLDAGQQIFFGLEADLALAAEEQETRDAADYERWVEARMVVIDEKKLKDAESSKREDLETRRLRSQAASQLAANASVRPLARPATNVGNRSWSYSSAYSNYRVRRPTYHYVYYNTPTYRYQPSSSENICSGRVTTPNIYRPPVVRRHQSFADTTIPSIP